MKKILRLLKFAACCAIAIFTAMLVVPALNGDKPAMCILAGFVIAGILTAITARRKGEKSAFKWLLYGALVPVVAWIDVAMLGAGNKAHAFMRGLALSVMGLLAIVSGFVMFLPDTPQKTGIAVEPAVSVDIAPVIVASQPALKVSTDAEISALRAKKVEELRRESAEYERQQREESRQRQAERERAEQEYLKQANTVVVTPKGKKYHDRDCRTLRGTYRELTIAQARKKGYTPCKVCDPPAQAVTHANIYWGDNVYTKGKVVLDVD